MKRLTYGLLVSGELGALCLSNISDEQDVHFVLTDKKSEKIVQMCAEKNIPVFAGNPRNGKAAAFLSERKVDVILSINYLFIIERDVIDHSVQYAINIHGSLLPKYRGRTPHVWAIINNEKETGITAHLINDGCDTGDIVYQESLPIHQTSTGFDVLGSFFERYPIIVKKLIGMLEAGKLVTTAQDESKATYFGKRTPEDGAINWIWQKERIYNWVRALAKPYPGAFTYYNDQKIIIHKVAFDAAGFEYTDPDGLIVSGGEQPVIKTSNGCIRLEELEANAGIVFKKGEVLHAGH
ncbi:methionyl-tRNA formyltransferase [Sediminibacterium roseum]|uniref:Methionyl-tRNA formyltransferase n=1 Tax=Sediminibacterium roseum TaxID=1978412 RepID=A0ABW9ZPQ9_9BACT|nr:methionyl-tRNA formyltransferase [Sediminibacterium roseum]NCI49068.1 methionyl-tRNA formyltransferase [Sediminibacterium roseum]